MIKFNPDNKETLTYGESLGPAMKITDEAEAQQYFADYVKFTERLLETNPNPDGKTAEEICKINLGYYAGYYGNETRERVERLFNCSHPVFGSLKEKGAPTPEEAFDHGKNHKP